MIELSRRRLFTGVAALIAAPTIVRMASLMPVHSLTDADWGVYSGYGFIDGDSDLYHLIYAIAEPQKNRITFSYPAAS